MKPTGSATFLENDSNVLWIGLTARDGGTRASTLLTIKDEVIALSFDLAVSLRLLRFDNEREMANKKFWHKLVTGKDLEVNSDPMEQMAGVSKDGEPVDVRVNW